MASQELGCFGSDFALVFDAQQLPSLDLCVFDLLGDTTKLRCCAQITDKEAR